MKKTLIAAGAATLLLGGELSAQTVLAGTAVNFADSGQIQNLPPVLFPNGTSITWGGTPSLNDFGVPVGQLIGADTTGALLDPADLVPLRTTALRVVDNSNSVRTYISPQNVTTNSFSDESAYAATFTLNGAGSGTLGGGSALKGNFLTSPAAGETQAGAIGVEASAFLSGEGTAEILRGLHAAVVMNEFTGSLISAYGATSQLIVNAGGLPTNFARGKGFQAAWLNHSQELTFVEPPTVGEFISIDAATDPAAGLNGLVGVRIQIDGQTKQTLTGLEILNLDASDQSWAIRQTSVNDLNIFSGSVGLGVIAPQERLALNGRMHILPAAAPTTPTSGVVLWVDGAGDLQATDTAGVTTNLTP